MARRIVSVDTLPALLERLEQSLDRSTNIVRLIQTHVDEPEKTQWEKVNEILYAVHSAVSGERIARRSTTTGRQEEEQPS